MQLVIVLGLEPGFSASWSSWSSVVSENWSQPKRILESPLSLLHVCVALQEHNRGMRYLGRGIILLGALPDSTTAVADSPSWPQWALQSWFLNVTTSYFVSSRIDIQLFFGAGTLSLAMASGLITGVLTGEYETSFFPHGPGHRTWSQRASGPWPHVSVPSPSLWTSAAQAKWCKGAQTLINNKNGITSFQN